MKTHLKIATVLACGLFSATAWAEIPPPPQPAGRMYSPNDSKWLEPSEFMLVTKIFPKPGMAGQVKNLEIERVKALKKANWPRSHVTISSITNRKQFWVLSRYDKVEQFGEDLKMIDRIPELKREMDRIDAAEGPLLESVDVTSVRYQPGISYRPRFDWSKVTAWDILWVQTKQAMRPAYVETRVMSREEHDVGAFDTHQMMYVVTTGPRSGTFFMMRPMPSLKIMDELFACGFAEPLSPYEGKWKVKLFAESTETEQETYFLSEPEMTILP